jgi:hypothetical protein
MPTEHNPAIIAPTDTILTGSRFVRACLRKPVDRTPVWFLRQAGRYMQEYRDVRKHHTLVEICKQPQIAAEVTITAAEKLGVDAAIIFADLLLPLEPMGLPFEFLAGEGPVVHHPVRTAEQVRALRTDRAGDLAYVASAIQKVASYFRDRLGIIGFCGAPFTLASYMIEGGSSKNYIHTKQMMYRDPLSWHLLLDKIVKVLEEYCRLQVLAGADVIQIFDSWVGNLGLADYRAGDLLRRGDGRPAEADGGHRRGRDRPGLAAAARRRLARGWPGLRGAGQPRPDYAVCAARGAQAARGGDSALGQWSARAYLQPWPRHCAQYAG